MPGIYLHVPFCKKACHYCNFHFSTTTHYLNDMIAAMANEIKLQKDFFGANQQIDTIYFGGGTPSILSVDQLQYLLNCIEENFKLADDLEFTVEANPDDLSVEKLIELAKLGVNRLSIGVQSFYDEHLQWMNRAHNATQAKYVLSQAQQLGFLNFNIDLIYGVPNLSNEQWLSNLATAKQMGITHLSCYALTVEDGTALKKFIDNKKVQPINEEQAFEQFTLLQQWAATNGYEQYEVSNLCLPNCHSRHNSSYWVGELYLGIGPSAHSYNGKKRQWNVSNNVLYLKNLTNNIIPFEEELLTATQACNEYIMTSLRTKNGLNIEHLKNFASSEQLMKFEKKLAQLINQNKIRVAGNVATVTTNQLFFTDGIAADLFLDE
jgi:oxygen-independent coproporphyrinogen III oxidase